MDANCVFCAICAEKLPAVKLYEDKHFLAILNRYPASRGHALVMPKRHVPDFMSLTDSECASLMPIAKHLTERIHQNLRPDGINLLQNNGTAAGQEIFHFHLHIIPRFAGDEVKIAMPHIQVSYDDLNAVAAAILS